MTSWYAIRARDDGAEVMIYDEIGAHGVSAKGFLAELGALAGAAPITLHLNSPGGSVFDAVAIYNALKRHAGEVTVVIDGIAASAASYVAMAGDTVVMPENAFLMIHDPSGMVMGTASDMRAMAEALDKIAGSLTRGYAAKAGRAEDEIAGLMAAETWFDAAEALELGLVDRMAEPVRIAASFDITRFRNAPAELVAAVEAAEPSPSQNDSNPDGTGRDGEAGESGAASDPAAAEHGHVEAANMPPSGHNAPPDPDPPDPAAIRAEALAHARAVVDLCGLAGQPQMAAGFLEAGSDLETVRSALLDARADAAPGISGSHPQPGPARAARPWGDVIARTFRRKGE